jgi:hypothetical protein
MSQADSIKGENRTHTHTRTHPLKNEEGKRKKERKSRREKEKDELLFALHQKSGGFASCVNKLQTTSICVPVFPFLLRSLCYFFLSFFFFPVVSFLISSPDTLPAVATPQGISRHRFLTPVFYRYFYLLLLKFFGGVLSIHSIKDVRQTKQTGAHLVCLNRNSVFPIASLGGGRFDFFTIELSPPTDPQTV